MKTSALFFTCFLAITQLSQAQPDYESVEIVSLVDKPIIRATLNGQEAFFLLDTGSSLSILDMTQARKFGYFCRPQQSTRKIQAIFLDGSRQTLMHAASVNLQIGAKSVLTSYVACNLSDLVYSLRSKTQLHISGIIGSDVMQVYGFRIDYDQGRVSLRNPMPVRTGKPPEPVLTDRRHVNP